MTFLFPGLLQLTSDFFSSFFGHCTILLKLHGLSGPSEMLQAAYWAVTITLCWKSHILFILPSSWAETECLNAQRTMCPWSFGCRLCSLSHSKDLVTGVYCLWQKWRLGERWRIWQQTSQDEYIGYHWDSHRKCERKKKIRQEWMSFGKMSVPYRSVPWCCLSPPFLDNKLHFSLPCLGRWIHTALNTHRVRPHTDGFLVHVASDEQILHKDQSTLRCDPDKCHTAEHQSSPFSRSL